MHQSSLSGGTTTSNLCSQLVPSRVKFLIQAGLVFHLMKMKYTGTAVAIMANPIAVSTGCWIMGSRVIT